MDKEIRIKKQKEKLKILFKDYTDRQLLELIVYSLRWLGFAVAFVGGFLIVKFIILS